ncbi:MAG: hypothetical protein V1853_04525 [bacterium]
MRDFESPSKFNPENQPEFSSSADEQDKDIPTPSKMKGVFEKAKEKVFSYLKYKRFKIKEYFGQLNQEDFDQLISFDFQEQLQDNPPIEGVFSPEDELAKIKSLPKEQRRESIATFKENLMRQRKALAACRVFIERTIEFNHDIPREKLIGLVEQFSSQYGFDDRQKQITEQLIDGYYENRQKALEIRQQFTDDHELVNKLTGIKIKRDEEIDVSVGPMTIDIETGNIFSKRLSEGADIPIIRFNYTAFASQSIGENPVYFTVVNTDKRGSTGRFGDLSGQMLRGHEYEHQKNTLFQAVFEHKDAPTELVGYEGEQDPEIRKVILEDFFSASRAAALEQVKDEFTASLYDRDLPTLQKQLKEIFFGGDLVSYDFLGHLRYWEEFKDDPFYQETAQRMLVQEYRMTVESAVSSYSELVNKGKYSTQEATALLTDKPLTDWPKTIRRLLES